MSTTTKTAAKATETAQKTVENFVAENQKAAEKLFADAQKAFNEQVEKASKGLEEATALNQENFDAARKVAELSVKSVEQLGSEITAFAQSSFDKSVAAAKDFSSVKTASELFEKQVAFAKESFDNLVAQNTKMNELYSKSAKEITAPLQDQLNKSVQTLKAFTA